ncbi:MAG: DUF3421 domain-containing protein [Marinobacterium sp.]|nr:DUF3421 domain-containing protein [Marinobacterium sp.]
MSQKTIFKIASNGNVPKYAVKAGHEANGETLYAAIANYRGGVHPGKVRSAFKGANIGYGGREVCVKNYQVLVAKGKWVKASGGEVPANALAAGHEADGKKLYLGRAHYKGGVHIGKVREAFGGLNIGYGGREVCVHDYEVFVADTTTHTEREHQILLGGKSNISTNTMIATAGHQFKSGKADIYVRGDMSASSEYITVNMDSETLGNASSGRDSSEWFLWKKDVDITPFINGKNVFEIVGKPTSQVNYSPAGMNKYWELKFNCDLDEEKAAPIAQPEQPGKPPVSPEMPHADKLFVDLGTMQEHTKELDTKVERIDDFLEYTYDKLKISKEINKNLGRLDSSLKTTSRLLGVARIIPQISSAASRTKRVVDTLQRSVSKAYSASKRVEKVVKPVRDKVHQAERMTTKLDGVFHKALRAETDLCNGVGNATRCIKSLPEGTIKTKSAQEFDGFCKTADSAVRAIDSVQVQILSYCNEAEKSAGDLKNEMRKLIEINNGIQSVMRAISPLVDSLGLLESALSESVSISYPMPTVKYKYGIPYPDVEMKTFRFSVKDILDGVNGVIGPVMSLLEKAMDKILDPILDRLNLNISLPTIPYLDELSGFEHLLQNRFSVMDADLSKLFSKAGALDSKFEEIAGDVAEAQKMYQQCIVASKK